MPAAEQSRVALKTPPGVKGLNELMLASPGVVYEGVF
jgi:hypothetical protein